MKKYLRLNNPTIWSVSKDIFLALFLILLLVTFASFANTAFSQENDLLFYLPFEENMNNVVNNQTGEAKNTKFVEGKEGQGVFFEKGSYLKFSAKDNINYRQGTVEFWFKPNWNGNDGGYHYFFAGNIDDAANINSVHVSKKTYQGGVILGQIDGPADEAGRAIEEAVVPAGLEPSPSSVANWKAGEWHHIAFSWDYGNQRLKLYIDGLLVAANARINKNAFPTQYQSYIMIGSSIDQVAFAQGVIDELKIWDKPLTDVQIAKNGGLVLTPVSDEGKIATFNPKLYLLFIPIGFGVVILLKKKNFLKIRRQK